ncbi:MAG: phosphate-starvation-inducible PsiE family protein [Nitrospirota bacterium]
MNTFRKIVDIIIKFMIPLVILALMLGIARLVLDLRVVFTSPTIAAGFDLMITNILSMFVVIELLRSIIEYFELHRLKITFITDAALVFVLREVMIGLYGHSLESREIVALAVLMLIIGGIRTLAIVFSPEKTKEAGKHE